MNKRTFEKILADPNFNPMVFMEDAITEFIQRYPDRVAEDKVALGHLVNDPDAAQAIVKAVDVNDPELLGRYFESLHKSQHWRVEETCQTLLERLSALDPSNADAIFAVLKAFAPKFSSISRPSNFGNLDSVLAEAQLFELMEEALTKNGTKDWETEDWKVAVGATAGIDAFIKALKDKTLNLKGKEGGPFQLISRVAQQIKGTPQATALIEACEARWDAYVCFACGRGSGLDRRGNEAPNNVIKSISGYTLHRGGCDPDEKFPSPWQIINGDERELSFECGRCGQVFTTASGLTLHQKKC
jgi:hypothetical protein